MNCKMPGKGRPAKEKVKSPAQKRLEKEFVPPPGRGQGAQGDSLIKEIESLREKLGSTKDVNGLIALLGETINSLQAIATRVEEREEQVEE